MRSVIVIGIFVGNKNTKTPGGIGHYINEEWYLLGLGIVCRDPYFVRDCRRRCILREQNKQGNKNSVMRSNINAAVHGELLDV